MNPALQRAIVALRAGQAREAERLAADILSRGDVLSRREEIGLATKILGQALLIQGRAEAAIPPLERAAKEDGDPDLHILLGRALGGVGREADALEALGHALAHRPPVPQAFLTLADYLWKLGRPSEAVATLEQGLSLKPDELLLKIGLGYFHLRRQDHAKARDLFGQVHAAAPKQHDALVGLAMVSALDGEFTLAADLYRRALETRPRDMTTQVNLAKCLWEMGERDAGNRALRAAAQGAGQITPFVAALADTARGRLFLRPSAARRFLRGETI